MRTEKTDWVDYAKGIGIILVVYGHVIRGLENAGISVPYFNELDTIVYSFHMPLFFFISGMFVQQSLDNRGSKGVILSKIDTLVYPYIIWSLCQGMIEVALSTYTNGNATLIEVLSLWDPRAQFWFLYVLFTTFCITCLIYYYTKKGLLIIGLALALVAYYQSLPMEIYVVDYVYSKLSSHWVYFMLGMLYQHPSIKSLTQSTRIPLVIACTLFVIIQILLLNEIYILNEWTTQLIAAIISILFVIELSKSSCELNIPSLKFLGISSMEIYLIHILTGSGARVILFRLGIDEVYAHIIIGTISGLAVPIAFKTFSQHLGLKYLFKAPISNLFFRTT
ncbi:acyltransferase family protein [Vibrio hangzhouensis]|uniref:acyltransferase family protein n=1 Tax=Vibrio hangzhouensis TaxID=462991 RepID=UPI001C97BFB6|nr:acyltransferase family protein [Vibrio hangzhouensis]MBY6198756.1 acyltransferase family protein [Vibrio hangzhouensis]